MGSFLLETFNRLLLVLGIGLSYYVLIANSKVVGNFMCRMAVVSRNHSDLEPHLSLEIVDNFE